MRYAPAMDTFVETMKRSSLTIREGMPVDQFVTTTLARAAGE
jgi:hypothetical protein